jgi:hypothetical protein
MDLRHQSVDKANGDKPTSSAEPQQVPAKHQVSQSLSAQSSDGDALRTAVSVIIPCFNQGPFLAEAIESVLRQTCPPHEIIVIDDGSTDQTSEILSRYPTICAIKQPNAGAAAARNAGIEKSRGDFLLFLDADDRLLPNAIEIAVHALNHDAKLGMVYGHCTLISTKGLPLFTPYQTAVESDHYRNLLERCFIWTPGTALFRRSAVLATGGFDSAVSAAADYEMFVHVARLFPIRCHGQLVLEYRQHAENISRNAKVMLEAVLTLLYKQWPYVSGKKDLEEAWRSGVESYQIFYGNPLVQEARLRSHQKIEQIAAALPTIQNNPDQQASLIREWQRLYAWTNEIFQLILDLRRRERGRAEFCSEKSSDATLSFESILQEIPNPTAGLLADAEHIRQRIDLSAEKQQAAELESAHARRALLKERCSRECADRESQDLRQFLRRKLALESAPADSLEHELSELHARWKTIRDFRIFIEEYLPVGARIAVVSRGDVELLQLGDRHASHFPEEDSKYCGYHPETSSEAISLLEASRAKGVEYIAFPVTSIWWLDYYKDFAAYLESYSSLVAKEGDQRCFSL